MIKHKIEKYKFKLRDWDGGKASFGMYTHENINIFMIDIMGVDKDTGVSIGFTKCTFISGPVKWKNIKIRFEVIECDSTIVVTDETSDFCVKCSDMFIGEDIGDVLRYSL